METLLFFHLARTIYFAETKQSKSGAGKQGMRVVDADGHPAQSYEEERLLLVEDFQKLLDRNAYLEVLKEQ